MNDKPELNRETSPLPQTNKYAAVAQQQPSGEHWHSFCGLFCRVLNRVLHLRYPDIVKIAIDCVIIIVAAIWTWFVSYSQVPVPGSPWPFVAVILAARLFIYFPLGIYRHSWLHVSRYEVFFLAISALLGPFVVAGIMFILPEPFTLRALVRPRLILATEPALYLLLMCLVRLGVRALYTTGNKQCSSRRVLIIGAGSGGRALSFQIQEADSGYEVVGFLDDDPRLKGRRIRGVPVVGTCNDLVSAVQNGDVSEIVIAIPSLAPSRLREMITHCSETGLPVRMLPPLRELIGRQAGLRSLREVSMEDLLPRAEVSLDRSILSAYLGGKTVLVTGGGGSIGSELCRQVFAAGAERLLVLGRGENSVFEIVQELNELFQQKSSVLQSTTSVNGTSQVAGKSCEIIPVICDVRDRRSLQEVFQTFSPQVVFHAAAHKHVPLMEQYPCEAVKNNVGGTLNVVQLAIEYSVERFVMVSTDKAVEPANVMGATKRIGEMIVKAYATEHKANMVCVRFGNVLGSRGSVVPTMTRQIKKGLPVTVTDPEMMRYFMTIPEAAQLILQAGSMGGSGEIYILEMGRPVRILDLAYDLIRMSGLVPHQDIPVKIIGARPGEKLSEELLTVREGQTAEKKGAFRIATSHVVQLSDFLPVLTDLIVVSERSDVAATRDLISAIIPDVNLKNGEHRNLLPLCNNAAFQTATLYEKNAPALSEQLSALPRVGVER